jgi:hypothetical protein
MYQLQIWGPKGRRVIRWDPRKLQERDPSTLAAIAEADRLLKEAYQQREDGRAQDDAQPQIAASGRWLT